MKTSLKICLGSDCKKERRRNQKIRELVEPHYKVGKMKCQDYCKGPVVQVIRGPQRIWFKKVRGSKIRNDLLHFMIEGELSKRLKSCVVARK